MVLLYSYFCCRITFFPTESGCLFDKNAMPGSLLVMRSANFVCKIAFLLGNCIDSPICAHIAEVPALYYVLEEARHKQNQVLLAWLSVIQLAISVDLSI